MQSYLACGFTVLDCCAWICGAGAIYFAILQKLVLVCHWLRVRVCDGALLNKWE